MTAPTKPKTQTSETVPPEIEHLDFNPEPWQCECPGTGPSKPHNCDHSERCTETAVFYTCLHMINECRMPGLTPDGGATRLLCGDCTLEHVQRAEFMAAKARQAAHWSGRRVICTTCERDLTVVTNFMVVDKLEESD